MKKVLLSSLLLSSFSVFATEPTTLPSTLSAPSHVSVFAKDSSSSNSDRTSRNVVKINLMPLAMGYYSLAYEFGFHKNFSVALGVGVFNLPKYIKSKAFPEDASGEGLKNFKMNGFALTPEIRFYPGKKEKHQAPYGFYLAPYLRYSKTNISGDFVADLPNPSDPSKSTPTTMTAKISYSGINGGLLIGKQWIAGKHFSIDWWILGGGYGKAKLNTDLTISSLSLTPDQQAELKDQLDSSMADVAIPGFDVKATSTTTSNGASLTLTGLPMMSIRSFGLSLGFAF